MGWLSVQIRTPGVGCEIPHVRQALEWHQRRWVTGGNWNSKAPLNPLASPCALWVTDLAVMSSVLRHLCAPNLSPIQSHQSRKSKWLTKSGCTFNTCTVSPGRELPVGHCWSSLLVTWLEGRGKERCDQLSPMWCEQKCHRLQPSQGSQEVGALSPLFPHHWLWTLKS